MGKKLVPVRFNLIEEGRLAESLDKAISDATQKLLWHVKEYGHEATVRSKASVDLKITVQFDGAEIDDFSIKAAIKTTLPGRPIHVTKAIHTEEQTGEEFLFIRASGSSTDTPRQGRLATDDGRAVDLATGEAAAVTSKPPTQKKKE